MAKGGASENETCRELSLWWSHGASSALLRRTQMSGGKATIRAKGKIKKKTPYEYGDITFSEPQIKPLLDLLLFENKSGYKDLINVLDFVDSPKKHPQLLKWWWKCEKERKESGRHYSVIVFRRTRKSKCIMVPEELFSLMENWCGAFVKNTIDVYYREEEQDWVIVEFKEFLNWVTPETITEILKEMKNANNP